jgi:hypothetical protein
MKSEYQKENKKYRGRIEFENILSQGRKKLGSYL